MLGDHIIMQFVCVYQNIITSCPIKLTVDSGQMKEKKFLHSIQFTLHCSIEFSYLVL